MTEFELAWVVGLFEGEGCITFNRSCGISPYTGKRREYVALALSMTDEDVVRRFHKIVGFGTITLPQVVDHRQQQYRWRAGATHEVLAFLKMIKPHLGIRRKKRANEAIRSLNNRIRIYH